MNKFKGAITEINIPISNPTTNEKQLFERDICLLIEKILDEKLEKLFPKEKEKK